MTSELATPLVSEYFVRHHFFSPVGALTTGLYGPLPYVRIIQNNMMKRYSN
ncbi:hypothetical protein IF690_00900 [Pseudomonas sp. SK3(2021)]|uniref:hypothetical protein n=1 Tax=Pseudomonas sp. SK3(2021) TaxID=2841064 RepID=UPI00192BFBE1|nr:hypothetical protein [Pseudomonas sp. SK3(2021)]QQZ42130.1 hypothetical protein IF690_00900 [Pseudomonas sp. SK3(2021)]